MVLPMVFGGGVQSGYTITNSARFNGTSAYLERTFGTPTSAYKGTLSLWFKRGSLGADGRIFEHSDSSTRQLMVRLDSSTDTITIDLYSGGASHQLVTSAVFRDPSSWYHLVLSIDTTQVTSSDRTKLFINGTQASFSSSTYQTQNTTVFGAWTSRLGARAYGTPTAYYSGYYSEVYFIDGQALTPSSFGKTDSNGVWVPIKYAGTYGTNGCKLEFKNSGALGTDTSGNGNNWTVTGIASTDQMVDTPTNNYCTWNATEPASGWTYSNGNLSLYNSGTGQYATRGTIGVSSGKWQWRVTVDNDPGSNRLAVGIANGSVLPASMWTSSSCWVYNNDGTKNNGGSNVAYGASFTTGDYIDVLLDMDTGTLVFKKNGASQGTAYTGLTGTVFPMVEKNSGVSSTGGVTTDFGQRGSFTPDSGYKTLCTANIPSVAVTTSGTFTGNANADGPFVWANGNPATLTINGNAVTFGTHADKTAGGFKLRTSSASYNTSGSNTWTATAGKRFVYSATSINNAQGNP